MAINLLLQPSSGASSDNADYTKQNVLINSKREIGRSILTDWESEVAAPSAGVGTFIREAGGVYQVQGTDENISGSPAAGINYIKTTVVGSVMTLEWVTVTTGYTYNEAFAGVYNGSGNQLLTDICYKDGTAFKRGRGNGMDFNTYILADGSVIYSGGLSTNGGDIDTGGGDINGVSISGFIDTNGGDVATSGGDLETSGGNLNTDSGGINLNGGGLNSVGGIGLLVLDPTNATLPSISGKKVDEQAFLATDTIGSVYIFLEDKAPTAGKYQCLGSYGGAPVMSVRKSGTIVYVTYGTTLTEVGFPFGDGNQIGLAMSLSL